MFRRLVHCSSRAASHGGLNWALAGRGVIVKDTAFQNLNSSQLYLHGATIPEPLSGLPVYVGGNVSGEACKITKAQFGKLLKQVTGHISSVSNIYVHDGAVGSSLKAGVKVRVISDTPSPLLSLSSILWRTSPRAVSHDSRPLTVYVATSISPDIGDIIGLELKGDNALIAADIERSSLVLCGNAFSDSNAIKQALATLSGPIIFARGGLPLSARLLVFGDSVVLLFAPEDTIKGCGDPFVPGDVGVILSSEGVVPLFESSSSGSSNMFKLPAAAVLATFDCSGVIPSVSKLAPGQAAFHFLAGFQSGKFMPAYGKGPSSIDPLELAKELLLKLKHDRISSYLVNANGGEKGAPGKDFAKLVESTLSNGIPPFQAEGGDLLDRYKKLLFSRFGELPEEFSF
ncbi:hypothetical protein ACLB2K_075410 [Fragaria x ananassa]